MTRYLRFVCLVLASGLLTAAFVAGGEIWVGAAVVILGSAWIVGLAFHWDWASTVGLFLFYLASAYAIVLGAGIALILPASLLVLVTWDLTDFYTRMKRASPEDDGVKMEKAHLLRLSIPILSGALFGIFALSIHLPTSFEWTILLMLFMVWGVGRLVGGLLREN